MVLLHTSISSSLAASALLLYDYVLTFEDEVEFVWKHTWSFGKVLYLTNRYLGTGSVFFNTIALFDGFSRIPCTFVIQYRLWSRQAILCFIESILLARVYALYDRNKRLLSILIVLFLVEFGITMLFLYAGTGTTLTHPLKPVTSNCFYQATKTLVSPAEIWLPLLLYVGLLFGLVLFKVWQTYWRGDKGRFLRVILRDCLYYYFSIFCVVFFNFMLYVFIPITNPQWTLPWLSAVPVLIVSRLFLNTRRAYYRDRAIPSVNITAALATRPS